MKKLYSIVLTVLLLSSCTASIVNHEKPYSDSKLKLEKHYTFYLKKNVKHKLYITKIDSLNIYGEDVLSNPKTIQKSDIITLHVPGNDENTHLIDETAFKKMQDGETRWAKYAFSVLNKTIIYCRNSLAQY